MTVVIYHKSIFLLLASDVIPWLYNCYHRPPLMKTLDWSVETFARERNSTGLCIHFNKNREHWLFSILHVLSAPPDQKQLKIFQLFIIRVADHRWTQKIGTDSLCAGSILFRSGPIACLFSWVKIGLYTACYFRNVNTFT